MDWLFFGIIILIAVIGYFQGFHRCLKFYFKGLTGWIITVFLCFMLGGMIKNIPFVAGWLTSLNNFLLNKVKFLANWGTNVIYYIILFVVLSLIKMIFTNMLVKLFTPKNIVMKILNGLLGACFAVVMTLMFFWLVLALLDMINGGAMVKQFYDFLISKNANIFLKVAQWNPIQGLFASA